MATFQDLRDTLYAVISTETGLTTIFAQQNAPRPDLPYCVINILSNVKIGLRDEQREINDLNEATYCGTREATVEVQFFGDDAFQNAQLLQAAFSKQGVLETFRDADMAIVDDGDVTDITTSLDSQFEVRAILDPIIVRYLIETTVDVDTIETVEINEEEYSLV